MAQPCWMSQATKRWRTKTSCLMKPRTPSSSGPRFARYGFAAVAAAAGFGLRQALTAWVGPGLPTFVTFYPAVMVAALLGGVGPGILVTVLTELMVACWILSPVGQFAVASSVDRVSLGLFACMGLFISAVAELYRRNREKAAAYDRAAALHASEDRLRLALTAANLGAWDFNPVTGALVWDARCKEFFGLPPEAEVSYDTFLAGLHPEDRERANQIVQRAFDPASGGLFDIEYRTVGLRDGGVMRWIRATGQASFNDTGQAIRFLGTVQDTTERKRQEDELRRLNRTLAALSKSNQALMHATDEAAYLQKVCQVVAEGCGHAMLWVGLAEDDEAKTVRPVASFGFDPGYLETLHVTWADAERGRGPTGTAIRTGQPCACPNMLTDPMFAPWRAEAIRRGFGSSIALPLRADEKTFGALTIYARQPEAFSTAEVEMLNELAGDLAHGITSLRLRAAHARAEAAMHETAQRIQMALHVSGSFAFEWDTATDGVVRSGNCGILLGVTGDGIEHDTGQRYFQRVHPEDRERFVGMLGELKPGAETYRTEYRLTRGDGITVVLEEVGRGFFDEAGQLSRLVGVSTNITGRKAAEEKLRQTAIELQAANESLRQSREAAFNLMDDALLARQREERASAELRQEVAVRQQAEQAAHASLARYLSFLEVTGQVGWTTNPEGLVTDDMPAWRRFTGQSEEEIKGWGWAHALHPDDRAHTGEVWRRAVQDQTHYEVEYRLRRHDGVYRDFLARGVPTFQEDGRLREWVGTCIDITERKLVEQALVESELFHRQTVESIPGMVFTTRPDGYCDFQNQQWVEFTGVPMSEHVGDGWNKLLHPEDRPRAFAAWRDAVEGRAPYDLEYRVRSRQGHYEWFKVQGRPIRDSAGQIVRWFGTALNIDALVKAQAALQRNERRAGLLAETAGEFLAGAAPQQLVQRLCSQVMTFLDCQVFINFLVDEPTRRLRLNACAGLAEAETQKIEWLDFGVAVCGCAARDGCRIVAEDIAHTPDPRTELVSSFGIQAYACHPLLIEGRLLGTLSFGTRSRTSFQDDDLTLMKSVADLVAIAMNRVQTEDRLKASLGEKAVLLQEVHHRVKNNLQVISSLINLQADTLNEPALRASLAQACDRVRTMALVHEKLYQSGDLACLNFADYAASLLHYLWRAHGAAAASVRLTLATEATDLPVDTAVPCGLILNELATNALKYAFAGRDDGEVTVGLSCDATTSRVCLRISDNGVGLPAGFDWRASSSLGLRLVQMLTQQIDGTVEVGPGPGTEFRITFPVPRTP